jgi:hypothetical protein
MKLLLLTAVTAITVTAPTAARADVMALYLQGHGGYAGTSVAQILPGADASLGPLLGAELGARLMAFDLYVNMDDYLDRGTVTRAVFGLAADVGVAGWRLSGRLGAGMLWEKHNVFGDMSTETDRSGVVGRVGVQLDRKLSGGLYVGLGIEGEYFAIKPTSDAVLDTSVHTGADILGSLHLRFELGI